MKRLTPALAQKAARQLKLPKGYTLRVATIRDLDDVMMVGCTCFDSDAPERQPTRYFLLNAHAIIMLLRKGKEIAGYVHIEAHSGRMNHYLNTVSLLPAYRGKGLGNHLYIYANILAEISAARSLWAHVAAKDRLATHMLEKNGYKIEQRIKAYYDDGKDALIMRKILLG